METKIVEVARGLTMPFYPMRPRQGSPIRTKTQVEAVLEQIRSDKWIVQPKLGGHRACLALVDKQIHAQTRHGTWRARPISNAEVYKKLRDRTCLDGEIVGDEFHPFECLAINGKSLLMAPAVEREAVALQITRLLGLPWLFARPTPKYIEARRANLPRWEGVVMKLYMSTYVPMGSKTQSSGAWLKCLWG
jgi:ATP-dependent DNA ligase